MAIELLFKLLVPLCLDRCIIVAPHYTQYIVGLRNGQILLLNFKRENDHNYEIMVISIYRILSSNVAVQELKKLKFSSFNK